MAITGIRGGDIIPKDLINAMIKSYNLKESRNVMFNSKRWAYDISGIAPNSTNGEISFYWNDGLNVTFMVIQILFQGSAPISSPQPTLSTLVDSSNTAVGFAAVGGIQIQSENITIDGLGYTIYFYSQEYQLTGTGNLDVWANVRAYASGLKDIFGTEFTQFLAIQHPDATPSLITPVEDYETIDKSVINNLAAHFDNSNDVRDTWSISPVINLGEQDERALPVPNSLLTLDWTKEDWVDLQLWTVVSQELIGIIGWDGDTFQTLVSEIDGYTKGELHTFTGNYTNSAFSTLFNMKYGATGKPASLNLGFTTYSPTISYETGINGTPVPITELVPSLQVRHISRKRSGLRNIPAILDGDSVNAVSLFQIFDNYANNFTNYAHVEYLNFKKADSFYRTLAPISPLILPEGLNINPSRYVKNFTVGQPGATIEINYKIIFN